ncbi:MAG: PadR family transcriptional regulator [Actinobacteria bacterium]|nr:PadR family transcriptional regulator [Actinomycetota bacterium]
MDEIDIRITPAIGRLLKAFLDDPAAERYGFELMQMTGMTSGSLYPVLAKLERAGWIVGEREPIDPREEGRPARRYYMVTAEGATTGAAALAEFSQQFHPSTPKSGVLGQTRDVTCRSRQACGIA